MFDFSMRFDGLKGAQQLLNDARTADKAAVRKVANTLVVPAMKLAFSHTAGPTPVGMLGVRTGQTRRQIRAKFWKGRDGFTGASVKVIGNRAHIARFGEEGTRRQPARKMFETVGRIIRARVDSALIAEFQANMKALGYK
jgi:HK97 gp10 family phage protein